LLDDLRALVEFAQPGSMARAADRLFRTPSAITRQVQRLEAAFGAELLDRSVKPSRLNSLGSRVLEQARDLLQRTEALKSLTSRDAEPHGLLRIGLAHALAEGTLIEPIRALTEKYAKVRVRRSIGWSVPASPQRLRLKSTTCICSWRSFSPVMVSGCYPLALLPGIILSIP